MKLLRPLGRGDWHTDRRRGFMYIYLNEWLWTGCLATSMSPLARTHVVKGRVKIEVVGNIDSSFAES